MSGGPRLRSANVADPDVRKPALKPQKKAADEAETDRAKKAPPLSPPVSPPVRNFGVPTILRQGSNHRLLRSNLSLNASCSSDASSDSSQSRASTGRISRSGLTAKRRNGGMRSERGIGKLEKVVVDDDLGTVAVRKRCGWVTANTEPCYAAFHDEEWGVPVHDDRKLFELLSLSGALAELAWPVILNKRGAFREVFLEFDPIAVSKLSEKKIAAPGSPGSCLLSELKLRSIIENARQICKVIEEFGSFDKYIWGFVNQKPVVSQFRNPRQVPAKTPKADVISKDLVKRGFRSVSTTVVYSFMQTAGLVNDHLISCYRFEECVALADWSEKNDLNGDTAPEVQKPSNDMVKLELARALDEISLCSDL